MTKLHRHTINTVSRNRSLMSDFNTLCKIFEEMDPASYAEILVKKSVDVIAGLSILSESGLSGLSIYADFILCAVAADGKLSEDEFLLLKPVMDIILQKDATYEDAKAIFYAAGLNKPKDYKKTTDLMVDIIGMVSQELKDDIVLICLMVCAVDGKVSMKEKKWIKQLVR